MKAFTIGLLSYYVDADFKIGDLMLGDVHAALWGEREFNEGYVQRIPCAS